MTDLHCHLLPGIDDGSKDVPTSLELLRLERRQRVDKIVFTSHFYPDKMALEDYVANRTNAFRRLMGADFNQSLFKFKLGAEVRFSPMLATYDLTPLKFTGTDYMLLEFPFNNRPSFMEDVFDELDAQRVQPIIAHVERYSWIEDYSEIYDWVQNRHFIIQSNAGSLVSGGEDAERILYLIDHNLVHVLSTDSHNLEKRVPNLLDGMKVVAGKLGEEKATQMIRSANAVFAGMKPDIGTPEPPKKRFGKWV